MDLTLFFALLAQVKPDFPQPIVSAELITLIGRLLFALWLFAVGASVGSFLNVVVYRLPARMHLGSPASRCPRCLHPIRWQHNIPILGWLLLRGRCADCQLPISTRYPLVETLVGLIFLLVGGMELLGNGINLPLSGDPSRPPLTVNAPWPIGAAVMLHLMLLTTLIAAALIDFDRHPIPSRLLTPVIIAAVTVALIWPQIHPVAAISPGLLRSLRLDHFLRGPTAGLLDVALGAAAGLGATLVIYFATRARPWLERRYGGSVTLMWIAIGVVFGWQLTPWLLGCWAVHYWLSVTPGRAPNEQLLPARGLAVATTATLLSWRLVTGYPLILDESLASQAIIYSLLVFSAFILLAAATRRLPVEYVFPEPAVEPVHPPAQSLSADEPSPS